MPDIDPKWLEIGSTGGLLAIVTAAFVFLLRYVIPKVIESLQDGIRSITQALKEVNTSIRELQKCVAESNLHITRALRSELSECRGYLEHDHEKLEGMSTESMREIQALVSRVSMVHDRLGTLIRQLGG